MTYDANGNSYPSGVSATYNVENQLMGDGTNTWRYDPWGRRIGKQYYDQEAGKTRWEFYYHGAAGQRLTTLSCYSIYYPYQPTCSAGVTNVYFGSKLMRVNGTTIATDRLGSVRAKSNGPPMSFFPYGEEKTSTDDNQVKFATYFRDSTGADEDYAQQRYYASGSGRFMSPDPSKGVVPKDPGTWNKYTYVGGDPVNFNDPSGLNRAAVECQNDPTTSNCSDPALGGGGFPTGFALIQSELNAYVQMVNDAAAAAAAHAFDPPDPNCVQDAISTAAGDVGLNLNNFSGVGVQIVGTSNGSSGTYGETELNLTGSVAAVAALEQQMCDLGFYNNGGSNGACQNNNSWLVGAAHSGYTGNFRSPSLTNSVQVNTGTTIDANGNTIGIAQIDVDPYNPAASPILGLILHGVLQVLPNKITGGDNTYGCK